jgi:predicted RNase H-like HicB family nuclease
MDYTVIYEETPTGFSAYLPDLPGCVAAGGTRAEVERLIRSAVRMHLEAMRDGGEPLPSPSTWAGTVKVAREAGG